MVILYFKNNQQGYTLRHLLENRSCHECRGFWSNPRKFVQQKILKCTIGKSLFLRKRSNIGRKIVHFTFH